MSAPIRFDDWVDRRLYGPDGFYERGGQAGRRGDFLTSVEVGPLFGRLVAQAIDRWWSEFGEPDRFTFVEVGAGRGTLARSVLRAPLRCAAALRYVTVERSLALRTAQAQWTHSSLEVRADLPDSDGPMVIFANELLDNLAFRLFERDSTGWREVWVDQNRPVLRDADEIPAQVLAVDALAGTRLPGVAVAADWVESARRHAVRVICVDYGVRRTAELADRAWLRTYRSHAVGDDPFTDPSTPFDITTDVPVDQLPAPTVIRTQAEWLTELGIDALVDAGRTNWLDQAAAPTLESLEMRSRVREAESLLDASGLGGFLVMEWSAESYDGVVF